MKAVILAGGVGSRLAEETVGKPKPMVEIGGMPILRHIIKIYSDHGINEFIICLGYKGYMIKEYFANYVLHVSDVTIDLTSNQIEFLDRKSEPWKVTLIDTGQHTMTGGRLKRVAKYLGDDDFCFTYGDGVGNVDITALIAFHRAQGTLATLTAARPGGRYGALTLDSSKVTRYEEKPEDGIWVNGGFFVLSPKVIDEIAGDETTWEREPLENLSRKGELSSYHHYGFWQPMDTLRDKLYLEELWSSGNAEWKIW